MAKCRCYQFKRDCAIVSEGLRQCPDCGNLWRDDPRATKPLARTPFRIGMEARRVIAICKRTGRDFTDQPEPLNYKDDQLAQLTAVDLKVRWDLTDGLSLFFTRTENQKGKPFIIYEIKLRSAE